MHPQATLAPTQVKYNVRKSDQRTCRDRPHWGWVRKMVPIQTTTHDDPQNEKPYSTEQGARTRAPSRGRSRKLDLKIKVRG